MIDNQLKKQILPFLKLQYPHSEERQININLKSRIIKKDIFNENRFDIIFQSKNKMTWHHKLEKDQKGYYNHDKQNDNDNESIK